MKRNKAGILMMIFCFLSLQALQAQEIKSIRITELEQQIAESKEPLIVNFWATWCKPCIEELPYFQQLAARYNVRLLLVSLDMEDAWPKAVNAFVKKRNITAPVVWLNETNADYFCPKIDNSWSGAIPASLFIHNATGYRHFEGNQLSEKKLEETILSMIWRPQ